MQALLFGFEPRAIQVRGSLLIAWNRSFICIFSVINVELLGLQKQGLI